MSDWREDLMRALHAGDPAYMKATLQRVPRHVLGQAIPPIAALASACVEKEDWNQALVYLDQLVDVDDSNAHWYAERAAVHLRMGALAQALADATRSCALNPRESRGYVLQGDAHAAGGDREQALAAYTTASTLAPDDASLQRKIAGLSVPEQPPPLPVVEFDPALYAAPAIPDSAPAPMVEGLIRHLSRYGYLQSIRSAIDRLNDPRWIAGWQTALSACKGSSIVFYGGELGVLPLLALRAGATKVTVVATNPLERRVTSGIIEKNRLVQWRLAVEDRFAAMSPEERQASFESFNGDIDVVTQEQLTDLDCDWLVFPTLDSSLLGTGLIPALKQCRDAGLQPRLGVLPARIDVCAMGVQWRYPATPYRLDSVNELRWSLQPEELGLGPDSWRAITTVIDIGSIDPWRSDESEWRARVAATTDGTIDAVLYWHRIDLGTTAFDTRDGLDCLKPVLQYVDPIEVAQGQPIDVCAHAGATRLCIDIEPPRSRMRSSCLPSWYIPMILDQPRNDAYRAALGHLAEDDVVLEIGAGTGLLSMAAADAGSRRVYGCEIDRRIAQVGTTIVADNNYAEAITLINKDCRTLKVGEDLPRRADVVLFELFDCGLLGEGILHFLAYAREHLAAAGARYLPMAARVRAMVVEARLDEVAGVDLNLLNPFCFSPSYINVDAAKLRYRPLSAPFDVFAFDFSSASPEPQEVTCDIEAIAAGTAGAVMFWFDLQLDEDGWLSNAPDAKPACHWGQALQYLPEVHVVQGMPLSVMAKHQGSAVSFVWREGAIPQEAYSRLPRVDPTSWAQSMELETQTQQLLQHCRWHPDEYTRVADVAFRIAADPASHGVDPKVAKRFATLFL